jgi:hypothetical protein
MVLQAYIQGKGKYEAQKKEGKEAWWSYYCMEEEMKWTL